MSWRFPRNWRYGHELWALNRCSKSGSCARHWLEWQLCVPSRNMPSALSGGGSPLVRGRYAITHTAPRAGTWSAAGAQSLPTALEPCAHSGHMGWRWPRHWSCQTSIHRLRRSSTLREGQRMRGGESSAPQVSQEALVWTHSPSQPIALLSPIRAKKCPPPSGKIGENTRALSPPPLRR